MNVECLKFFSVNDGFSSVIALLYKSHAVPYWPLEKCLKAQSFIFVTFSGNSNLTSVKFFFSTFSGGFLIDSSRMKKKEIFIKKF